MAGPEQLDITIRAKTAFGDAQKGVTDFFKGVEQQASQASLTSSTAFTSGFGAWGQKFAIVKSELQGSFNSIVGALGPLGTALSSAFSVSAVIAAGREVLQFASTMSSMSAQTGIGTERLQALQYAASGADVSVDQIVDSVTQLAKRLVSGDDSAVKAVERLGLSVKDLTSESPDQAFLAISDAIKTVPNPMERAQLAMELFGRSGAALLPALTDNLRELTDEAENNGAVVSRELIEKADSLGDAWGRAEIRGKAFLAGVLIPVFDIFNGKANSDFSLLGQIDRFVGSGVGESLNRIRDAMAAPAFQTAPNTMASLAAATHGVAVSSAEASRIEKELAEQLAEQKKRAEELARAHDQAFGLDNIKRVQLTVAAIGGLAGVAKMDADSIKALHEQLNKAIDAAEKNGQQVPASWSKIFLATQQAAGSLQDYIKLVGKVPEIYAEIPPPPKLLGPQSVLDFERTLQLLAANPPGVVLQASLGTGLHMGQNVVAGLHTGLAAIGGTLVSALEGGGNVVKSLAATMGSSFSQSMFGNDAFKKLISKHFGDALGGMFNAFLPGIGALAGPLIDKIGSLFSSLFHFGGPSKQEKEGRSVWDDFVDSMRQAKTATEDLEIAQNVAKGATNDWATAAVVLKDKYVALGLSGDEALQDIARMQAATKQGAGAVQAVIEQINEKLARQKQASQEAGATGVSSYDAVKQKLEMLQATLGNTAPVNLFRQQIEAAAAAGQQDFSALASQIDTTISQATDAFGNLRDAIGQPINIDVNYSVHGSPSSGGGGGGGGGNDSNNDNESLADFLKNNPGDEGRWEEARKHHGDWETNVPGAASGGLYSRPTMRVIAESRPEIVGAPDAIADALYKALERLQSANPGVMTGGAAPNIQVFIGDQELDRRTVRVVSRAIANGKLPIKRSALTDHAYTQAGY